MSRSRVFLVLAGALVLALAGACSNDDDGPQATQYPKSPVPTDGAAGQPIHVSLSWQDGDADHPAQSWDVCFGIYNNPPTVSPAQTGLIYDPGTLAPGTTYHWNVVARYADGGQTRGPEWTFTTGS